MNNDINELNFLRLFCATVINKNYDFYIKKIDVENKLYKYYEDDNYKKLFIDINKKDSIDYKYVDLNDAFSKSISFGMLSLLDDNYKELNFKINYTKKDALGILKTFNEDDVLLMDLLVGDYYNKNNNKILKLIKN